MHINTKCSLVTKNINNHLWNSERKWASILSERVRADGYSMPHLGLSLGERYCYPISQGRKQAQSNMSKCTTLISSRVRISPMEEKTMTNLDHIFKSRDITLPTKVCLVKAMVFPVVMYGCESWTIKKAEHWRTDAFELWCWRRLLRVPWTTRRSN